MKSDNPFSPGDRVIAYLRDSGHEKQELSVDQQEKEIRSYCLENDLVFQRPYIDEARKGSSDEKREQLSEMMNDLRHGLKVAGVIVWSNSRFARNSLHAQFYRAEIRKLGYVFHSLTGKTIDGPEAIIFEALDDYKNERFLADLSLDVKRGLKNLVLTYGCVPGSPPTGFLREKIIIGEHRDGKQRSAHKWVPDPLFAPRVRQAFEMRVARASLSEINEKTRLFNSVNSYRTFFCNKIYLGTLVFGDDLVVEKYCEPMVDQATWDAVQRVQNDYTRHRNVNSDSPQHPRRINSNYLLSGLVHCGRCGSPLFGRSHPQKNGSKSISYFCTRAYNKRDCTKQRIPGLALESAILRALKESYLRPEYIEAVEVGLRAKNAARFDEYKQLRSQASAELGEVRRQISNLSNAIAESGHSRALLTRLSDLELQENELLNRQAALETETPREIPEADPKQIVRLVELLDTAFPKAEIQQQRQILRMLVKSITSDRDGRRLFGSITVYYPPGDALPSEANPPTGQVAGGGMNNVRISRDPSGPVRVV